MKTKDFVKFQQKMCEELYEKTKTLRLKQFKDDDGFTTLNVEVSFIHGSILLSTKLGTFEAKNIIRKNKFIIDGVAGEWEDQSKGDIND